ncbi:MAG: hypothetical protein JNK73_03730 [Bacteroidia bacterium]|nr:hypothetical protein [Bacteroidia bacterium]
MKNNIIYFVLTLGLLLTTALVIYFQINTKQGQNDKRSYTVTTYAPPTCADPDYLNKLRAYQTFTLTTDTIANEQALNMMRFYLNKLKTSGDSLNGVHVIITDNMPYKYYLKAVEIFNELPPRMFYTIPNNFYAISSSKYQQIQDSILKLNKSSQGHEIIGVDEN